MNIHYAVHIIWSEEDQSYLASTAELPGGVADGATPAEALANLEQVIANWIEVAQAEQRPIPRPMTLSDLEKTNKKFAEDLNTHIEREVQTAVARVLQQFSQLQQQPTVFYARGHFAAEPCSRW